MKILINLLVLFLVHQNVYSSTLKLEINQIISNIEVEEILKVSKEYFENDSSVQKLIRYLLSEDFKHVCNKILEIPEVEDVLEWMSENSVNVSDEIASFVENFLNITPVNLRGNRLQTFSIKSFENEISELINIEGINSTIDKLLENGQDLAHLYLILKIKRKSFEKLLQDNDVSNAINRIKKFGINIDIITINLYKSLRWDYESNV